MIGGPADRSPRPFDALGDRAVRSSVESLIGSLDGLSGWIHPSDEMLGFNLEAQQGGLAAASVLYLNQGFQIFDVVREAARGHFGSLAAVPTFLDFASGWGRMTRHLVRELPADRVFASEIDAAALRFQSETFGVGAVASASDPTGFAPGREFSFIFAASFFSHLPKASFERWAERLLACLAPGGLLLFSVHGTELAGGAVGEDGVYFLPESETRRLDGAEYGTSYVSERFVRAALAAASGGAATVAAFPRGLCAHQDLYAVARPGAAGRARSPLTLASLPAGGLDHFSRSRHGTLLFAGWVVAGSADAGAPQVELLCNGRIVESLDPCLRWRFEHSESNFEPDDVILIRAVSRERQNVLAIGTLKTHPPAAD